MQRSEGDHPRRGAVPDGVGKDAVRFLGIAEIAILCFLRKGIVIEPAQQFHIHAQPAVGVLRRVDMQIDHAGHNELAAIVVYGQVAVSLGDLRENTLTDAVRADGVAVLIGLDRFFIGARADIASDDEIGHL